MKRKYSHYRDALDISFFILFYGITFLNSWLRMTHGRQVTWSGGQALSGALDTDPALSEAQGSGTCTPW